MSDAFLPALADIKAALDAGEYVEDAIRDAAGEHKLPATALRNRARLAWGSLGERRKEAIRTADKRQEETEYRRAVSIMRMLNGKDKDRAELTVADRSFLAKWLRENQDKASDASWEASCRNLGIRLY